jgi:hypothetical protein
LQGKTQHKAADEYEGGEHEHPPQHAGHYKAPISPAPPTT